MEHIEIDGEKFRLVPVEEEEVVEKDILEDYTAEKVLLESNTERPSKPMTTGNGVVRAKGKKFDHRERYKARKLRPSDVKAPPRAVRVNNPHSPETLDPGIIGKLGHSPWIGEGTTIDY